MLMIRVLIMSRDQSMAKEILYVEIICVNFMVMMYCIIKKNLSLSCLVNSIANFVFSFTHVAELNYSSRYVTRFTSLGVYKI